VRIRPAAVAAAAIAVATIGGGVAAAQMGHDDPVAAAPSPSPSITPAAVDPLSEENVIRERLYFDVSGHSFSRVDPDPKQTLGPCTGDRTFTETLPGRGVTTTGSKLVGDGGLHVIEQLAQTGSAQEAGAAAEQIVSLVKDCAAISGGDFGYGDPVTVVSESSKKVVYFPAFDSDAAGGGYVVFNVGTRVGVVDVADGVGVVPIAHLAKEAATIAAD
jgi:hypothetical protein